VWLVIVLSDKRLVIVGLASNCWLTNVDL
jgi:hypothetical protein